MKGPRKKRALVATVLVAMGCTGTASASVPVFDLMNFASNVAQNVQLTLIKKTLTQRDEGTINYYTNNIDKTTNRTYDKTVNIDNTTTDIKNLSVHNTEINNTLDFTLIINRNGGGEIIPVPRPVIDLLAKVHAQGGSDSYAAQFRDASAYYASLSGKKAGPDDSGFEGSRARKAANDALVKIIDLEQERLKDDAASLVELSGMNKNVEGHARQLQVANALAGSQANQLMQMRSMMMASESARAAESQAASDKEGRAIATAKHLRSGLEDAILASNKPQPSF